MRISDWSSDVCSSDLAKDEAVKRFEHEGATYSYTVTKVGDTRVIHGVEERTGKPFTLRVGSPRVRGPGGSQQVSFTLRDVQPPPIEPTTLPPRNPPLRPPAPR